MRRDKAVLLIVLQKSRPLIKVTQIQGLPKPTPNAIVVSLVTHPLILRSSNLIQ